MLLLLDNKFVGTGVMEYIWNDAFYQSIRDESWPEGIVPFDMLSTEIQNEIQTVHKLDDDVTIDFRYNKVEYILEKVYPYNRTWHNWLEYEWKFRPFFDTLIPLSHDAEDFKEKNIFVVSQPDFSYKRYIKFNTSNNNISKERSMHFVENFSREANKYPGLIIKSEDLFCNELDYTLYKKCIDYFDLDDLYSQAKIIHSRWYNLHKLAEQQIIADLTKMYND